MKVEEVIKADFIDFMKAGQGSTMREKQCVSIETDPWVNHEDRIIPKCSTFACTWVC